jgi:uncharacterized protein
MSEILYPFQLTQNGSVATTGDVPSLEAQQHVDAIVSTAPGERVMLPTYGVPLLANLFLNNPDAIAAGLANDVTKAMATFEPSINVISVTPTYADQSEGLAAVLVDYSVGAGQLSSSSVNTATILVGGQVDQIIRSQA